LRNGLKEEEISGSNDIQLPNSSITLIYISMIWTIANWKEDIRFGGEVSNITIYARKGRQKIKY
jgi:hypothetical protein